MKGRAVFIAASFGSVIALAIVFVFQGNISAFAWHMRHGFHREVNGIRFAVPLFYEERDPLVADRFSISSVSSPIRTSDSSITVEFPHSSARIPSPQFAKGDTETLGLTYLGNRAATLGSRAGNCTEYMLHELVLGAISHGSERIWIICRLGELLIARFEGPRRTAPEFYWFLEHARETKH